MGIPEVGTNLYEGKVKNGHILISAYTEGLDEISKAKGIFEAMNASDISALSGSTPSKGDKTAGARERSYTE